MAVNPVPNVDGGFVVRRRSFTVIYDDQLQDGMSLRAWGLYSYLVGRPPGWECRTHEIIARFKEGRDAVIAARAELVDLGLLVKENYLDGGLRRVRYVLDPDAASVAQTRRSSPEPDFQAPGSQEPGSQEPRKPPHIKKDAVKKDLPKPLPPAADASGGKETAGDPDKNDRADVHRLCDLMVELLVARGCKRPRVTKEWRDSARLLLDTDRRPLGEALTLMRWAAEDPFWRANVLSLPKFRDQYDQLRLRAETPAPAAGQQSGQAALTLPGIGVWGRRVDLDSPDGWAGAGS